MEAHQTAVSDPVSFPVKKGMTLTVSLYFADFTLMQSAVLVTGPLSKGFFSLGDQTHADALPMDTTKTTNWFYFLSNIELMTAEENHTVICYGDSITGCMAGLPHTSGKAKPGQPHGIYQTCDQRFPCTAPV